jgi:hypothetical protein
VFYNQRSKLKIASESFGAYMRLAQQDFEMEQKRCQDYLGSAFEADLIEVFRQEMLVLPIHILLEKETALMYLFKNDMREDLKLVYTLYEKKDKQLALVAGAFSEFIYKRGVDLIADIESRNIESKSGANIALTIVNETNVVENLVESLDKYREITSICFSDKNQFERARQNAFEDFMSKQVQNISFAELIGTYTDKILKKSGSKHLTNEETEEYIKKIVSLFTHLTDKDVFIDVYRNLLARRLLNDKCESIDYEKLMIT